MLRQHGHARGGGVQSQLQRFELQALGAGDDAEGLLERRASAELGFDAGDHASGAEASRRRLVHHRTADLFPCQHQRVVALDFPMHRQPARHRRERAVFGRIGHQLMERQGQRLRRRGQELQLRARDLDLARYRIGREFLVDQPGDFRALRADEHLSALVPTHLGGAGATLSEVADDHGATPMQVALAFLLHRAPNILLIPGTASLAHLDENLAAAEIKLPSEALARLDAIGG